MRKHIIVRISIIACVALCAAVWPRSAEVGDLPAESSFPAVNAEIEARSAETPHVFISADVPDPEMEHVAESEPKVTEITAEKETQKTIPAQMAQSVKPTPSSSEPRMGDVRIVNGQKQIYIDGFGWIEDEGGGSVGTRVGNPGDHLTANKVGIMGGGTTVDGKGDINKHVGTMGGSDAPSSNNAHVPGTKKYIEGILHMWVSGFGYVPYSGSNVGTVAEDMYENGHKTGIMGGAESAPNNPTLRLRICRSRQVTSYTSSFNHR